MATLDHLTEEERYEALGKEHGFTKGKWNGGRQGYEFTHPRWPKPQYYESWKDLFEDEELEFSEEDAS